MSDKFTMIFIVTSFNIIYFVIFLLPFLVSLFSHHICIYSIDNQLLSHVSPVVGGSVPCPGSWSGQHLHHRADVAAGATSSR